MGTIALDFDKAFLLEEQVRGANEALARSEDVPEDILRLIVDLAEALNSVSEEEARFVDPYLFSALLQGVLRSLRAVAELAGSKQKREIRIGFEQIRQALRDIDEVVPVRGDKNVKDVARWLVSAIEDVPQSEIAEVLGIDPRTLQRWVSVDDPASPRAEQAMRLRVMARLVNDLRHVLTGPGVIRWFLSTQTNLGRKKPADLLDRPDAVRLLLRAASGARSSGAA